MAQLHLAFASPVTAVERQDEWKLSDGLGKFDDLTVLIRQLKVGKALADFQVHGRTSNIWISDGLAKISPR
jgi:hypothetical protein